MKKFVSLTMATVLAVATLASCSTDEPTVQNPDGQEPVVGDDVQVEPILVAMTTDSGTIDDKSFNQGTWEGIVNYEETNPGAIKTHYVKPAGEAKSDYLNAYADLVDAGYQVIFSPGYKFETAVYEAQELYPEVKFVILDGFPHSGEENAPAVINENTESIFFAEHESGFYAGIAAALSSETGKVGYIGGIEMPAVQKFGWGFTAGVAYANATYGTDVVVSHYIYQGTFSDVPAGQTLAGSFYNDGVDVIFSAAGGVGVGVINEGKIRRSAGSNVWVIGVDVDQYGEGLMEDGTSVILTSAMKDLGSVAYTVIDQIVNGTFEGGQMRTFNSANNGVGLPDENPNLTADVEGKVDEVFGLVANEELLVPSTLEELEAFLTEYNYTTVSGVKY